MSCRRNGVWRSRFKNTVGHSHTSVAGGGSTGQSSGPPSHALHNVLANTFGCLFTFDCSLLLREAGPLVFAIDHAYTPSLIRSAWSRKLRRTYCGLTSVLVSTGRNPLWRRSDTVRVPRLDSDPCIRPRLFIAQQGEHGLTRQTLPF